MEGQEIHMNASESPFQIDKLYFLEVAVFDELAEDWKVVLAPPRGVPLSQWEDLK